MSQTEIAVLRGGREDGRLVTVTEGRTEFLIAAIVGEKLVATIASAATGAPIYTEHYVRTDRRDERNYIIYEVQE